MSDTVVDLAVEIDQSPPAIELHLTVSDPEMISVLSERAEGLPRNNLAMDALKMGLIAIRHASRSLDAATIQTEAARMIGEVGNLVTNNANTMNERITGTLREYFDPSSGKLPERLDRLFKKDGELSNVLSANLDGDASRLVQTLNRHVGENSPIMKLLSPEQKDGILLRLGEVLNDALRGQREKIEGQFSLDDANSALSRLVRKVSDGNGELRKELTGDLKKVTDEFDLNNGEGALSRLVKNVQLAQQAITNEFSKDNQHSMLNKLTTLLERTHTTVEDSLTLDKEESPLSRLSREIRKLIADQSDANIKFQGEVKQTLNSIAVRKEEAAKGTQHGIEFEGLVASVLAPEVRRAGDLFDATGNSTGAIPRSKVGDHVVTCGSDCHASGSKIVLECKEDASYNESKALAEIQEARQNREAQIGIFIFSRQTAPSNIPTLRRIDRDILCVWDKEDPATNIVLSAALCIAKSLVVRSKLASTKTSESFKEMDTAVRKLEKDAGKLTEILTWAGNISRDSKKILESVSPIQADLELQLKNLRESIEAVKTDEGV